MRRALTRYDLDEAAALLARLKQEDPFSSTTRGGELELLLCHNRMDEATWLASTLVDQFPASARILYLAGRVAYHRKEYRRAEALLTESLALHGHYRSERWLCKTLVDAGKLAAAEPRLLDLTRDHPAYLTDLAWLYERKNDLDRAEAALVRYLEHFPDSTYGLEQRQRLRALRAGPEQVVAEMEAMELLDEPIPDARMPRHLEALLQTGRSATARELVRDRCASLAPRVARQAGWTCYKLQAHDLAVDLFLRALPTRLHDHALLNSLDAAALRAGRVEQVLEAYDGLKASHGRFYGRINDLKKRQAKQKS